MYMRWRPQFAPVGPNPWKHIGEIVTFPEIVDNDEVITFQAATRRHPIIAKGVRNTINSTFDLGFDREDAGQVLMRTARGRDEDFQFKIELRDFRVFTDSGAVKRRKWTTVLFRALVTGYGIVPGGSGQFIQARATLAIPSFTFQFTSQDKLANAGAPTKAEAEAETDTEVLLEEPYTPDLPPDEEE
jgi:hypothetical protein